MKIETHGNGNGLDDLFILPDTNEEAGRIIAYLHSIKRYWRMSYANIEGHAWYGRSFIDIPFGEHLKEEIEGLAELEGDK